MEPKVQLTSNGQEVQTDDINAMGEAAALADDRVLAEFLRIAPYNGSTATKGVIPYSIKSPTTIANAYELVVSSGISDGKVTVHPFRAIIGARTAVGTDSKKNWRDIRSTIYLGSTTALSGSYGPFTNGNGVNPRWDLLYAVITPDLNSSTVTRYIKNPTTEAIAATAVVARQTTTVTLAVQAGTAGASPALPAIPADGGGSYNIPIAYIRIAAAYTSGTGLLSTDIFMAAPIVSIDRAMGVITTRPATSQFTANQTGSGPAGLSTTAIGTWGSSGVPPKMFLPPTAIGGENLIIGLDLTDASSANWSIANYGTVDDSRDWRKRMFFSRAMAGYPSGGSASFAWQSAASPIPNATFSAGVGLYKFSNLAGQSFTSNMAAAPGYAGPNNGCQVFQATDTTLDFLNAGATIYLYVDDTDGKLKFYNQGGNPRSYVVIYLEAIGPIPGY